MCFLLVFISDRTIFNTYFNMIFAIQLNYNKVSNLLVTYTVSIKFILFSLLKIYVTTPLHMGLINFKIIGKINIAFHFLAVYKSPLCIYIFYYTLFI